MNPLNSTSSPKPAKSTAYNWANKFFKAPTKVDNFTKNHLVKDEAILSGARNATTRTVGSLMKDLVDYDFRAFPALALGKHSISLAEPPKGALLLLLYPGTVIPRLYRAYQRGKQNNDYREMGDVLRRDLTAITLFVFALGPVVQKLSSVTQRLTGVKLLDPESKAVLKYSQFKNYQIDNEHALKAILTEDNGKALVDAVEGLHDRGLSRKFPSDPNAQGLNKAIGEIKASVKALVGTFEEHNKSNPTQKVWPTDAAKAEELDGLVKKAMTAFQHADKMRDDAVAQAKKGGSAEMAEVAEKMQGEFKGVLTNYAKTHRLPADLVSFAILVGAIGYLPMWFNTEWNKRQFEKKMAAKAAAAEKAPKALQSGQQAPPPSYQDAIKTPPAYQSGNTRKQQQPPAYQQFAGPTFGQPAAVQPFGMLSQQMAPNPFSRTV